MERLFDPLSSYRRFLPISDGMGDDEPEWVRKSKMRHSIEFKLQSAHNASEGGNSHYDR